MGIELRKNGLFYYRKVWRAGRCVSEYAGAGMLGVLAHQLDRMASADQAAERATIRAQLADQQRDERAARELADQARELASVILLATGHHKHKGQWRRRRRGEDGMIAGSSDALIKELQKQARAEQERRKRAPAMVELPPLPAPDDMSPEAIHTIVTRCNHEAATPDDVAALRRVLKERGDDLARLGYGNRMRQAIEGLLTEMQAAPLVRELSGDYISRRRKALGYADAPALEKPLIDHLLLCELRLGLCEHVYTLRMQGSISLDVGRYWDRHLAATQRRYLAAVETLARIRRIRVELARITAPDGTSADIAAVERPGS